MSWKRARRNSVAPILKRLDHGVQISSKQHSCHLMGQLHELWTNDLLCDITLKVGEEKVLCHRNVLAASSDYFRAMFTLGLQESQATSIDLEVPSALALRLALEYIYVGCVQVSQDEVQELLVVADMLQLQDLKTGCINYMDQHVDITNCLGMLTFAEQFHCGDLAEVCLLVIKQRFIVVAQSAEVVTLPAGALSRVLHLPDLSLGPEEEDIVVKVILRWLEHDPMSRSTDLSMLAEAVRWSKVSDDMRERFLNHPLVVENPEVRERLVKVMAAMGEHSERHSAQCIYVIGGYLQSRTGPTCPRVKTVEKYQPDTDTWTPMVVADLPFPASGVFAFAWQGKLLCLLLEYGNGEEAYSSCGGGVEERQCLVEYNPVCRAWQEVLGDQLPLFLHHAMLCHQNRGSFAWDESAGLLYMVDYKSIYCVEMEEVDGDVNIKCLEELPVIEDFDIDGHRVDHMTVVCQGRLYSLGGSTMLSKTEFVPETGVFMYDSDNKAWVQRAPMGHPRAKCAVTTLDGHIYAIGGFDGRYRLRTVECYDPVADLWSQLPQMDKQRCHLTAVAVNGKIYAIGGKSYLSEFKRPRKVLNTCEVFDPAVSQWSYTSSMGLQRCMAGAAVI